MHCCSPIEGLRFNGLLQYLRCAFSAVSGLHSSRCSGVWLMFSHLQVRGRSAELIPERYEFLYSCPVLILGVVDAVFQRVFAAKWGAWFCCLLALVALSFIQHFPLASA